MSQNMTRLQLDSTEPETTYESKTVMLRAERHDTVEVTHVHQGSWALPKRFTVVKRAETYYGTSLTLTRTDTDTPDNYRLTCPGPDTGLVLWQSVSDDDGFRQTWAKVAEVDAEIVEVDQYTICDACGEPLRTLEHERLAIFGACERLENPNQGAR